MPVESHLIILDEIDCLQGENITGDGCLEELRATAEQAHVISELPNQSEAQMEVVTEFESLADWITSQAFCAALKSRRDALQAKIDNC